MSFKYYIEKWECHGCGKETIIRAIKLPNLCNQPLCLCRECECKLENTIKEGV